MYSVLYTREATKVLTRMPGNLAARIQSKIELLAKDPFAPNNNVKALAGSDRYRLRVGDWRVIYQINGDKLEVIVLKIGPRGEVYR